MLLYTPEMLHAKVVIFDDRLAVIGSANMDIRSLFLNYEVSLFVWSTAEVERVAAWGEGVGWPTPRGSSPTPGWPLELAENVVRLLSPSALNAPVRTPIRYGEFDIQLEDNLVY